MKKILSKVMVLTLVLSMFFTVNVQAAVDEKTMVDSTVNYLVNTYSNPGYGNEWNIIAMARSYSKVDENYYEKYYTNIVEKMKKEAAKKVPFSEDYDNDDEGMSSTDVERVTIALSSIGKDPTNVSGLNLIDSIWHWKDLGENTGINELTYALIALDTKDYKEPKDAVNTRDSIIKKMLEERTKDGGFSYITAGDTADVDSTAMAVQALYKYKDRDDVKEVINTCLKIMRDKQSENGDYVSVWMGTAYESPCTAAEVVVALDNLGIDPTDPSSGFVKNNRSLIDVIKDYYVDGGGFKNAMAETSTNEISTYELTYAMDSYLRLKNNDKTLYNMVGESANPSDEKPQEKPQDKPQQEESQKTEPKVEDKKKPEVKTDDKLQDNNQATTATATNVQDLANQLTSEDKSFEKGAKTGDMDNWMAIAIIMFFSSVGSLSFYNSRRKIN